MGRRRGMCNGELGRLNPSARPTAGGIPCGTFPKSPAPVGIRLPCIGLGQAGICPKSPVAKALAGAGTTKGGGHGDE